MWEWLLAGHGNILANCLLSEAQCQCLVWFKNLVQLVKSFCAQCFGLFFSFRVFNFFYFNIFSFIVSMCFSLCLYGPSLARDDKLLCDLECGVWWGNWTVSETVQQLCALLIRPRNEVRCVPQPAFVMQFKKNAVAFQDLKGACKKDGGKPFSRSCCVREWS